MARKTFFSFHYERDAWRASQVRNSNVIPVEDEHGFIDACDWEEIKEKGDLAIERWIAEQMEETSVTAILIGAETSERAWVLHEVIESWNRGNALVGVLIHNIRDQHRETDIQGENPLDAIKLPDGRSLSAVCKTYDWVLDEGRFNLGLWLEEAFQERASGGILDKVKDISGLSISTKATAVVTSSRSAPTIITPHAPWCSINVSR